MIRIRNREGIRSDALAVMVERGLDGSMRVLTRNLDDEPEKACAILFLAALKMAEEQGLNWQHMLGEWAKEPW